MRQLRAQLAIVLAGVVALLQLVAPAIAGTSRHAAMILDANTGAVLHDDNGDERRHPASLTKMMTLYLTFEAIERGRMSMSSSVSISQEAASVSPSKLDLDPGETLTVREAVLALITKSANDVAVALAEKIGGNERNFARLMNAKARELGMSRSNFENASGLPDPQQITTARDMITLGLRLQDDFPQYYGLFATRSFTFRGRSYRNHNTLMNNYGGTDGIKTGYTRASGFNLVTSVRRNGRHLVGAVFGGRSAATRNGEMRVLLTRAFNRASRVKTRKPAPQLIAKLESPPKPAKRPVKPKPAEVIVAAQTANDAASKRGTPAPAETQKAAPQVNIPPPAAQAKAEGVIQVAAQPPAQVPPRLSQPQAPAPIEVVGKVRRIMVAPRRTPRANSNADQSTDMEASEKDTDTDSDSAAAKATATTAAPVAHQAKLALLAPPTASEAPQISETIIPKTTAARPYALATALEGRASLGAGELAASAQPTAALSGNVAPLAMEPKLATAPTPARRPDAEQHPISRTQNDVDVATAREPTRTTPARLSKASWTQADLTSATQPARPSAEQRAATPRVEIPVQRGKRPSTLQAQASAITDAKPQHVAAASSNGRFEIQIGAYVSVSDAQQALSTVQARAGSVVANYASVTQPVDKGGRTIYRARFRGYDANSAANACVALRKQSFDCFVMAAY